MKYVFLKQIGKTPLVLYTHINANGTSNKVSIIDLSKENLANPKEAIDHLNNLLSGKVDYSKDQLVDSNGLYNYFKARKFRERIGEYYMEDSAEGKEVDTVKEINKTKKRVISYILDP